MKPADKPDIIDIVASLASGSCAARGVAKPGQKRHALSPVFILTISHQGSHPCRIFSPLFS
jgi:hypothetical protein